MLLSQLKSNKDEYVKFKISFKNKIDKAFALLKTYYPDISKRFQPLEQELSELREFRNLMIHSRFVWNESDLSKFIVYDVVEEKNEEKMNFLTPIHFNLVDVNNSINTLKGFTLKFIIASQEIDDDLRKIFPDELLGY